MYCITFIFSFKYKNIMLMRSPRLKRSNVQEFLQIEWLFVMVCDTYKCIKSLINKNNKDLNG